MTRASSQPKRTSRLIPTPTATRPTSTVHAMRKRTPRVKAHSRGSRYTGDLLRVGYGRDAPARATVFESARSSRSPYPAPHHGSYPRRRENCRAASTSDASESQARHPLEVASIPGEQDPPVGKNDARDQAVPHSDAEPLAFG